MNWITKNIMGAIADCISGILDVFGNFISNIFDLVADVNLNSGIVTNCSNFTILFGLAFLGLAAGKQILDVYVFQTSGDPDTEPLQIVVRIAQACAVICSSTWIFNEFLKFTQYFTSDLLSSAAENDVSSHMKSLVSMVIDLEGNRMIGYTIILLLLLIGFVTFCVVAGIRGAELTLMKILFPLFAVDLLTTNRERWRSFFTTYVITFMSYSIQLLCFKMCSMTFVTLDYDGNFSIRFITVIGWMVMMIRAPKWMEKFAYSSGLGGTVSSGIRFLPLYLLRK